MRDAKESNSSQVLGMRDTVEMSASPDGRGVCVCVCVCVDSCDFIAVKPLSGFPGVTEELES